MGGCASSPAATKLPPKIEFIQNINVVKYGVLGEAMGKTPFETRPAAPKPGKDTLIVDPASIQILSNPYFRPADAGGAAGAIYRFLGIDDNTAFPPDVVSELNSDDNRAAYKRYGFPDATHVIHVIGPDFKVQEDASRDEAVSQLARAYAGVLRIACQQPRQLLRLVPISSGIYAGKFRDEMPHITAEALLAAFEDLEASKPELLKQLAPAEGRQIEMCIFNPTEADTYAAALASCTQSPAAASASASAVSE